MYNVYQKNLWIYKKFVLTTFKYLIYFKQYKNIISYNSRLQLQQLVMYFSSFIESTKSPLVAGYGAVTFCSHSQYILPINITSLFLYRLEIN